jgi:hypothetical protein
MTFLATESDQFTVNYLLTYAFGIMPKNTILTIWAAADVTGNSSMQLKACWLASDTVPGIAG